MSRALDTFVLPYALPAIKGCTAITAVMGTADQAALNTNGALIVAEDTMTNILADIADAGITIAAQPDVPRNVVFAAHNDSGGPLNLYEGTMKVVVTGKFRGKTVTEIINITSTGANKAVANTKYRAWAGSQPFESISDVQIINPMTGADAGLKFALGIGDKLGLPFEPADNKAANIVKVCVDSADLAVTYDATYQTVKIGTRADGKTGLIWVETVLSHSRFRHAVIGVV